jgi:hypothetical protein
MRSIHGIGDLYPAQFYRHFREIFEKTQVSIRDIYFAAEFGTDGRGDFGKDLFLVGRYIYVHSDEQHNKYYQQDLEYFKCIA